MKKVLLSLIILLALSACTSNSSLSPTATLDGTVLYETAVSQVTVDFNATQHLIPTQTLPPAATWTAVPTLARTRPEGETTATENPCDMAAAGHPIDVSIPDGTILQSGEVFSKTWRLENVGSCTWTRLYAVVFFSGNSLSAHQTNTLAGEVEPGDVIDVTVDMEAPLTPGEYQSNWMLSNADGELFGIGPHGDAPFWVLIEVVSSVTDTPAPTPTVTSTPVVYLAGEAKLGDGDQLDLDAGTVNPGDATLTDVVYQYGGEPLHVLMTMNGAVWAIYGETAPTFDDCSEADLSSNAISFADVPVGAYICYRSSEMLPGRMLIEGFEAGQLQVSYLTWAVP